MSRIVILFVFLFTGSLFAQSASAIWPLTSITGTAVTTTGNLNGQNESFSNMVINNYSGPSASQRVTTTDGVWPAESNQNDSRYIQFTVSPQAGYNFILSSISMQLGAAGGGNMRANLWYSTSADFTDAVQLNSEALVLPNGAFISPAPSYGLEDTIFEGQSLYLRIYPWYTTSSTGKYVCPQTVNISGITDTGILIELSTSDLPNFGAILSGNNSASVEYSVSGSNLIEGININSPASFEISLNNSEFVSSLQIPQSGGVIQPTAVFVRFSPSSANGTNSGQISHTTLNAETKYLDVTGIAITTEPTVQSSITFGNVTGNTIQVNFIGGNGNNRILVARTSSAVNWIPEDGQLITGVNSNFSQASDKGNGNKVVYDGTGTSAIVTGLYGNTTYHFAVFEYNSVTNNSHNYLIVSPGTGTQTTPEAPTIIVNPAALNFGNVDINSISTVKSYMLSANTLTPLNGNINLTAPTGFEISLNSVSGFGNSLQIPYTGGVIGQTTIYVRFTPLQSGLYSGNISNEGGGAPEQVVSVSGNGIIPSAPNEFEAEKGLIYRAEILNQYPGFSGSGYVYLVNRRGAWVEVLFRRDTATSDTITVHYSNGSGSNRTLSVSLNESVLGNLTFPKTNNWTDWTTVKYIVPFQAGVNRLRFTTTGTNVNPLLDKIFVGGVNATPVYKLDLISSGNGDVSSNPSGIYFDVGTNVTLSAVPSNNYNFTRWFGTFENFENPHTLAMNSHTTAIGIFMPVSSITPFPYNEYPIGFASLTAYGKNGTTGGTNGNSVIVTNGAELWEIMLDRQDPNNNKNLSPLTVYIVGTISPVSGVFGSSKMLDVKDAYDISIIGVGNDATITGFGLKLFRAKNIIVRNITFASCPDDGISIDANDDPTLGHHIWVDHCTFTEIPPAGYPAFSSYDGALDITHTASFITVSWNHFTNYDKNSLIGHSNSQVTDTAMYITYHHNYFDSTRQRNPRVRFAKVHIFNNYYRSNALYGVSSNMGAQVMVEGNYFENVLIPTETSRDGSPQGFLVQRDNIFINSGTPGTGGNVFEPSNFYDYSMNPAATVPGLVQQYAGAGLYDFSRTMHDPIPVELYSFTAEAIGLEVILRWITATEINNSGFEIEKLNGTSWEVVGFVSGHGTISEPTFYTFTDRNSKHGKYSYRLKQIDFDGSYTYSHIVEVDINIIADYSLSQNYPNPFNPSTMIRYQIPEKSDVSIKVFDVLGSLVQELVNDIHEPGQYELQFDGRNLSSGVYFYQLKSGNFIQTNKMILIK